MEQCILQVTIGISIILNFLRHDNFFCSRSPDRALSVYFTLQRNSKADWTMLKYVFPPSVVGCIPKNRKKRITKGIYSAVPNQFGYYHYTVTHAAWELDLIAFVQPLLFSVYYDDRNFRIKVDSIPANIEVILAHNSSLPYFWEIIILYMLAYECW